VVLLWIIIPVVVVVLIGDICFRRYATRKIKDIFENVPPFGVVPAQNSPDAETLRFTTSDGLSLAGSLTLPENGQPSMLVIFFPELNGNHWMATHYCQALLDNGCAVLGFDFRNQGESDCQAGYTPIHWITEFEMKDVAAVMEFIESDSRLSQLPLAAFGVSRGGAAAIIAACRYPRIRAVITDSAFGTMSLTRRFVQRFSRLVVPEQYFRLLPGWHVELTLRQAVRLSEVDRKCRYVHLEQEVRQANGMHVLLISGDRDSYVTPQAAKDLAGYFSGEDCMLVFPKAKHNMARAADPERYDAAIVNHLKAVGLGEGADVSEAHFVN
jgi:pimeloyl-ACP methyl ester carboxylesterase